MIPNASEPARPELKSGETPLLAFVSSVMRHELQWAREETVRTLDGTPFLSRWAFEFTPASSEIVDEGYLRKVREADLVIWLIGKDITDPVRKEVREALASNRRLLAIRLPSDGIEPAIKAMLDEVGLRAKWGTVVSQEGLREQLELTIGDEIIRAMRCKPDLGRLARLEELGRTSRARCMERWQALGLNWNQAADLADDPTIGALSSDLQEHFRRSLILIVGDMGAGKSLTGERILQEAIRRARDDSNAPIPVYLSAEEPSGGLQARVLKSTDGLGNPRIQGSVIVIDGVDEIGMEAAAKLLAEARVLGGAWPNTTIVITSRLLPIFDEAKELVHMPLLGEAEAEALVARFAKMSPSLVVWGLPKSINDAIRRPLFAILLGIFQSERNMRSPRSTGDLLAFLAERAIGRAQVDEAIANEFLQRLAALCTERGGSNIPISELAPKAELKSLLESGLVIERSQTVGFPLPILTQWFAAQSLASGIRSTTVIAMHNRQLELWRYPLTIAVGTLADADVAELFAPIAEKHPGFAAKVIEDGLVGWGLADDVLPPPYLECGHRVRTAMQAWSKGIGPLAQLIAPVRKDGTLLPIGARTSGAWLTTSWYRGDSNLLDVCEFPAKDVFAAAKDGWFGSRGARPGRQSAWAWKWALDELVSALGKFLRDRALPLPDDSPLMREANWMTALALTGNEHRTHICVPISLATLEAKLSLLSGASKFYTGSQSRSYNATSLRNEISELRRVGRTELTPAWPGPDLDTRFGCRPQGFSEERLLARAKAVYTGAVDGYCQLVNSWFSSFSNRLDAFAILPARLVGIIDPGNQANGLGPIPVISFYMEALPPGSQTQVDFCIGEEGDGHDNWKAGWETLLSRRQEVASWISHHFSVGILDIFDPQPATKLAYEWLKRDLKRLGWTTVL